MAQYNLAVLYAEGTGVLQDYVQEGDWCRKAAEQGIWRLSATLVACITLDVGCLRTTHKLSNGIRRRLTKVMQPHKPASARCIQVIT